MRQTDILIAGGGNAGLTLALLLADIGLQIDILEPYPPKSFDKTALTGRTVALMESSLNIIKAAGVWETLKGYGAPLETMAIIDDSVAKKEVLETAFEARDIGLEQFGFNIPNAHLRAALFEKAKKTKAITIHSVALEGYETTKSGVHITTNAGKPIEAKLLVGADGRKSMVRELSGIQSSSKQYDQVAITCVINHSKAHQNIATEFHRPSGPFALVPLPGNQSSVVWVETPDRAEQLIRLKKHEFEQALQGNANNVLGGVTLEVGPESWPLCTIKAKDFIAVRTALVAEAAHVMSPITAQGLNLSLRDVAALAEVIADALRLGLDYGSESILRKYQKRRQLDINTRVFGVDGMNRIVSNDIGFVKELRRLGLKTTAKVPVIKRFAMNHGLAPQLDLGRLAKGGSL